MLTAMNLSDPHRPTGKAIQGSEGSFSLNIFLDQFSNNRY